MPVSCGAENTKKKQVTQLISNEEVLKLRLSQDEKIFYTELFYDNSKGGKVSRENFYPLLGALGTQISKEFTDIIFSAFSSNKKEITICEYLKYIDIYHYGDDRERCTLTCTLMDPENEGKISLKNFEKYLNLIMNAVKKVTYNSNQELMSSSDISDLFYHISKQKQYFTYKDFEEAYRDKPELISWFDYFKNNKSDLLITINNSIMKLLSLINKFLNSFMSDLIDILDNKKKINVKRIIQSVMDYSKNLEKERKKFLQKISQFNVRWALEQSSQNETQQIIKTLENKFFKNLTFQNTINMYEEEKNFEIEKEDHKQSSITNSNSKNEKLINTDIIITNRDSKKNIILNTDTDRDNDDINSQSFLIKNSDINKTPNINNDIKRNNFRASTNEFPLLRMQTKHRVMKFFSNFKEELNKKKTIFEKGEEEEEENLNNHEKDFEEEEDEDNFNINNNKFHKVKTFDQEKNDIEKMSSYFNNIFEEKEDIKEECKNNINNINNFDNINFNKFQKNDSIKLSKINTNSDKNNKDILNIDNIKLNFGLKDTYKSDEGKTIYNNSDVDSEFTVLEDKILRDDNIIYVNDSENNNILIKEAINKNFSYLKQLLLCSRTVIKNAYDIFQTFSSCYKWINENYLKLHIKKKLEEEEKERLRREEKAYDTKNNVARKKKKVKKKIIRTPDESFKILLNIIMGIQIAVQSCPNFRFNKDEDISNYLNNMIFSIQTINFGKKQEEIFYLKEYAGIIFNNIRIYLGIDKESFISSISPQEFVTEIMISSQTIFEELCSTGKSGSLFYYTRDGRFIVKTISKKEYKFLKKILSIYYNHLRNNPLSFLPKFLGCYKLIRERKKKKYNIYFIVMINVFATSNHIDKRYDLKGSKIGRKVLKGTEEDKKILNSGDMALKDLDFENRKEKVLVGSKKNLILAQLEKDSTFLEKIGSNDYSLLLGIHNLENVPNQRISAPFPTRGFKKSHTINYPLNNDNNIKQNKMRNSIFRKFSCDKESEMSDWVIEAKKLLRELYDFDDGGILSSNGQKIYYIGIIDILTEYGLMKKTEHLCKMLRYCSEQMSCIPPNKYKERYINYMNNTVFDGKEYWKKINLNDEENNIPKKNLCFSQNLNSELNKIDKNEDLYEDKESNRSLDIKKEKTFSKKNDNIINTEDVKSEGENPFNINFNKKKNLTQFNNNNNDNDNV